MNENHTTTKKHFDPTKDNPYESAVERFLFDKPWVRLSAVCASLIAGLYTAKRTVEREFYDENKEREPYKVHYDARQKAINENYALVNKGERTAHEATQVRNTISTTWRTAFADINKKRGIPTEGWTSAILGPIEKAKTLSPGDVERTLLRTTGAFAATLGVYMAVRQISRFRGQLNVIDDKLDRLTFDMDNSPSRPSGSEPVEDIETRQQRNLEALAARIDEKELAHTTTATRS